MTNMAPTLPDDILYMICTQLWHQRDFDTLYHCSLSGKQLAVPALTNIYRYYIAPFVAGGRANIGQHA